MKKHILVLVSIMLTGTLFAQFNMNYFDKTGQIMLSGGGVTPGVNFADDSKNGLFAKKGWQAGFDYNYIFGYGLGLGFNIEYDNFKFNGDEFYKYTEALTMHTKGNYSSVKIGLNLLVNVPIELGSDKFVLNLFGEGNAGFRSMSIPEIDLTYHELANKYTEVTYRSRGNTMGYLGYSGGLQFFFLKKYGLNLTYSSVLQSRHSINYSVRKFDVDGQLYEDENYVNDYLDHTGFQIGFLFLFGKK